MQGKIAIEEHWESPEVDTPATFGFVDPSYVTHLNQRLRDVDRRVEEMDAAGISISVLSLTQPGVQGIRDRRRAVDFARRMNDYAAETLTRRDPARLKTFACVALQDPEQAALEARRACKELGCIGIMVNGFTDMGDDNALYLDDPEVLPFWEAVSELEVPVYLHPRMPLASQRKSYAGYPGLVGSAWGFGIETATHALRLMLSGLFDRFPRVNVLLGHLGEGLALSLPRVEHRLRHQLPGSHGTHLRSPMEYLCDNFYLTTSGTFRTQGLLHTLGEVGVDRVLFAVDYPYESMAEIASWFDECAISPNDKRKIASDNARRLFAL
jgi:2,3-dihydroxybenzoate decarboxylase